MPPERSRLLPPVPPGPPPINTVSTPTPSATAPRVPEMPQMLTPERMSEAARMCERTVSPDFVVDTSALYDARWAYTQPRQASSPVGPFEYVQYSKDDLEIALQDYGPVVVCRAIGVVESQEAFASLRSSVASSLGATLSAEAAGLEEYHSISLANAPGTDPANLYIHGDYSLEFMTGEIPAGAGGEGSPALTMVMLTSMPIPPQYRTADRQQSAE